MADATIISKFEGAIQSMANKLLLPTAFTESVVQSKTILEKSVQLETGIKDELAKQTNILNRMFDLEEDRLQMSKDAKSDAERNQDLQPDPTSDADIVPTVDTTSTITPKEQSSNAEMNIPSLLKNLMLAPFVFKFVDGFLNEITNGLLDLTPSTAAAALRGRSTFTLLSKMFNAATNPITRVFDVARNTFSVLDNFATNVSNSFKAGTNGVRGLSRGLAGQFRSLNTFEKVVRGIGVAFNSMSKVASSISRVVKTVMKPISWVFSAFRNLGGALTGGPIGKALSFFGKISGISGFIKFLGPIGWVFSTVMGLMDAFSAFQNTEGSFMDKLIAGVGAFVGEIVGAPLDLLKSVVGWVLGSMGMDAAAEWLSSWSFEDIIGESFGRIWDFLTTPFDIVFDLLGTFGGAFGRLFEGDVMGFISGIFTGLFDIVTAPVNMAINWISSLFGWENPTGEPWKLSTFIGQAWQAVKDWFSDKFSWGSDEEGQEGGWFSSLITTAVESVKAWFAEAFSFLPSMEDIRTALTNMLPSWLRPESQDEERARLVAQIEEESAKIAASESGENVYWGSDDRGREDSRLAIEESRMRLSELDAINNEIAGLNRGGIVTAPKSGGLVVLHGTEAVIPLESPRAANRIEQLVSGSSQMSKSAMMMNVSPTTINRGGTVSNSNNSNTTIINNTVDPYRSLDPSLPR